MNEYHELLEACIALSTESVKGSIDELWNAFHEIKFTLLFESEQSRDLIGLKIKSVLQTSQDTWSFGKLWRVQKIFNEFIIGGSMLDFIMCPTFPNGNTFQFSPYVFTLCVLPKYNEADIKKFIDIIYRQHNHSNGWVIPIICNETEDSDTSTINSTEQIPIHIKESEIDCSAFCMFIAKPYEYLNIGVVVLSIINFHYQSYYKLCNLFFCNIKLTKSDLAINFGYLTDLIAWIILDHGKLTYSCIITHTKYKCIIDQYEFQDAVIPLSEMFAANNVEELLIRWLVQIFIPRTSFVFTLNFLQKLWSVVGNFSIYWDGNYTHIYQTIYDRLVIKNFLEDIYWKNASFSFLIKTVELFDTLENNTNELNFDYLESLPGFINMLNILRDFMNSLTNYSSKIRNDGNVIFRDFFSKDLYTQNRKIIDSNLEKVICDFFSKDLYTQTRLDIESFFKKFTDMPTSKLISHIIQQDPLEAKYLEDGVRNLHLELRVENERRIFQLKTSSSFTSQEVITNLLV